MRSFAVLPLAVALVGCGNPQGPASCTQAYHSQALPPLPGGVRVAGGFLTIKKWKDNAKAREGTAPKDEDLEVLRCAASVRFLDEKSFRFHLVTASHCLSHILVHEVSLELASQDTYETIPIKIPAIELAKKLRTSPDLQPATRLELGTLFKKIPIQIVTGAIPEGHVESMDVSFSDVEYVEAFVEGDVSLAAMKMLKEIRKQDLAAAKSSNLAGKEKELAESWNRKLLEFEDVERKRSLALYLEKLAKCAPGETWGSCPDKDKVTTILKSELPKSEAALVGDASLIAKAKSEYEQAAKTREVLWLALAKAIAAKPGQLYVHSNFVKVSDTSKVDTTKTAGDAGATRYGVASFEALVGPKSPPAFGKSGFTYKQSSKSSLRFQVGDSGTLFSFGGVPVGVIATLDFGHTSGGASVVALPRREAKQEKMTTTSSSKRPEREHVEKFAGSSEGKAPVAEEPGKSAQPEQARPARGPSQVTHTNGAEPSGSQQESSPFFQPPPSSVGSGNAQAREQETVAVRDGYSAPMRADEPREVACR